MVTAYLAMSPRRPMALIAYEWKIALGGANAAIYLRFFDFLGFRVEVASPHLKEKPFNLH